MSQLHLEAHVFHPKHTVILHSVLVNAFMNREIE